jgi:hypothetical protein
MLHNLFVTYDELCPTYNNVHLLNVQMPYVIVIPHVISMISL